MVYPPNPHYSRSVIKRAGEDIRTHKVGSPEYQSAVEIVNEWRVAHGFPMEVIAGSLRTNVKKYRSSLVAQRLKRLPTIIDKLGREPEMALSRMQDIGGTRAILKNVAQVYETVDAYASSAKFSPHIRIKNYIIQPKDDGYRGVHIIFKYQGHFSRREQSSDYQDLTIEAQIRTQLQHNWATALETMGTMRGESYKTHKGDPAWLEFFALTSSAFAILENCDPIARFSHMNFETIARTMKSLDSEHRMLEQIQGFSFAANVITTGKVGGDYNLISLTPDTHTVRIKSFKAKELSKASHELKDLEDRASRGENLQSVLVSAGKLKSLKVAYPNYFLDIKQFTEKIEVIYSALSDDSI